jgi:hypothetical protein
MNISNCSDKLPNYHDRVLDDMIDVISKIDIIHQQIPIHYTYCCWPHTCSSVNWLKDRVDMLLTGDLWSVD